MPFLRLFILMGMVLVSAKLHAEPTTSGAALFQKNCAVCHRVSGAGTPGLAPPIVVNPGHFAQTVAGRQQLIWTLLFGMYGDVVIEAKHYNFKMPVFANTLSDAELADTLNYVVRELNHQTEAAEFTDAEIAKERLETHDGSDVLKHRASLH